MAQVTIYINNDLEIKVKKIAKHLNTSISKYISSLIEKNINHQWNPQLKEISGSWKDFSTLNEIRELKVKDSKREEF